MALSQPRPTPEDDINAVLGRFRAWTSSTAASAASPSAVPSVAPSFEEITYEEALKAHRPSGLPVRQVPLPASPAKKQSTAQRLNTATSVESAKPAAYPSVTPQRPKSGAKVQANCVAGSLAARRPPTPSAGKRKTTAATGIVPKKLKPGPKKSNATRVTGVAAAAISKARLEKLNKPKAVKKTQQSMMNGHGDKSEVVIPVENLPSAAGAPLSFQAILKESLGLSRPNSASVRAYSKPTQRPALSRSMDPYAAHARTDPDPYSYPDRRSEAKSIAMKLRMSPQEHSKMKADAAEAGVTLAAYMRQCTLDVHVLRALLNQNAGEPKTNPRLAALQRATPSPGFSVDGDTFITRFKALLFGRRNVS